MARTRLPVTQTPYTVPPILDQGRSFALRCLDVLRLPKVVLFLMCYY